MDDESWKVHSQIEVQSDAIEVGQSLKNISSGYGIGKCFSCSRSWIMRIARRNEPVVRCSTMDHHMIVPHDIIECSRYEKKGELDIMTLIQMHNPVDLSKPDKVMGFSKEKEDANEG